MEEFDHLYFAYHFAMILKTSFLLPVFKVPQT